MKALLLSLALLLTGCTYGYESEVNVTRSTNRTCTESAYMPEVYFEDGSMTITKPYEQLGLIEVKGAPYAAGGELLFEMKRRGSGMGADAIINIRQHYITREKGELISQILDPENNKPEAYETIALTGIAIRYKRAERPADTLFQKIPQEALPKL